MERRAPFGLSHIKQSMPQNWTSATTIEEDGMIGRPLVGLAHAYILSAAQYWHATRVSMQAETEVLDLFSPVGLLMGMATELALKAFLLQASLTPKTLRVKPYAHDLKGLLVASVKNGMELTANEVRAVVVIHATHHDHFFRYGWVDDIGQKTGLRKFPDFDVCLVQVGNLIDRISNDPSILRNRFRKAKTPFEWPPSMPVLIPVAAQQIELMFSEFRNEEKRLQDIVNPLARKPGS